MRDKYRIKEILKNNIYLIIPIITIALWALYCIWFFRDDIIDKGFYHSDLKAYRSIGYNAVYDPSKNYPGQWYMPISGYFFFIFFTVWPIPIAHWICFSLNYISAVFLLFEFNKILKIMNIERRVHRFLFLIISANGWFIFWHFHDNTFKFLTGFIILLILRREMHWNKEEREKNLIYYIINYSLFIFILGWAPYLFYFFIIYVFYKIPLKSFFKRENIKKYIIILIIFLVQNFLFVLYPSYFIVFATRGVTFPTKHNTVLLLYSRIQSSREELQIISNTLAIILLIIALFFAFYNHLDIQKKISYFSIFYILLSTFRVRYSTVFLIPLIMLLFVPFLIQDNISFEFIKENFYVLIGLSSIALYLLFPTTFYGGFMAMVSVGLMIGILILLHIRKRDEKYLYSFLIIFIIIWVIFIYLMMTWFYADEISSIIVIFLF